MSHKSWIYTLNNYTEQEVAQFKAFICTRHRCAKEVGENGTPHLQGTIVFSKSCRVSALKKLNPRAHWEHTIDLTASLNYCTKGEIIIDIDNREQGSRTDYQLAWDLLVESRDLVAVCLQYPAVYGKCYRGMESWLHRSEAKKKWYDTKVRIFWGPSGSGKSKEVREIDPNVYSVPEPINQHLWFDEYFSNKSILLDDFYGWIKYHTLLQLCDGYPMQMPIKGSFVTRQWETVFITSNKPWEAWYSISDQSALKRRITEIRYIGNEEFPTEEEYRKYLLDELIL